LWPNGKFVTTDIVVRTGFLQNNPDVIKKLLEANVDEINWINKNPDQARQAFNTEYEKLTTKTIPDDQLKEALSRLDITYDPIESSLFQTADNTFQVGFLGDSKPDISKIFDLSILNQVLEEKNLPTISANDSTSAGEAVTSYIPQWVKNNARWWAEGSVTDSDFVNGIQYLVQQKILQVPDTVKGNSSDSKIPSWIKKNAGWWADGQLTDGDFVKGIQYLISHGTIKV
jgi:hypothetical protein